MDDFVDPLDEATIGLVPLRRQRNPVVPVRRVLDRREAAAPKYATSETNTPRRPVMIPFRRNHAQAFERIRTMNALPGSPLRPATRWASSQSGTCMEASARSSKVLVSGGCRSVGDISPSKALLSWALQVR